MARRTFSECDAELLLRFANRTDITSTMRAHFLNDALLAVALEYVHPEIEQTISPFLAANNDTMAEPITDLWWIEHVQDTDNDKPIYFDDKANLLRRIHRPGNPSYYVRQKNDLIFDAKPTVDLNMKVYYVKRPAEWTSGSPVLDQVFDPVLIMKAAIIGYQTVRDFTEAHVVDVEMGNYVSQWKLPKREMRKNDTNAGIHVRMR